MIISTTPCRVPLRVCMQRRLGRCTTLFANGCNSPSPAKKRVVLHAIAHCSGSCGGRHSPCGLTTHTMETYLPIARRDDYPPPTPSRLLYCSAVRQGQHAVREIFLVGIRWSLASLYAPSAGSPPHSRPPTGKAQRQVPTWTCSAVPTELLEQVGER
jgi:hypothetical protein